MKPLLRLAIRGLLGLALLLALAVIGVYALSEARLRKDYAIAFQPVAPDPLRVGQGRHLAVTRGCTKCHGADLGGAVVADQMPVMRLAGANLTRLRNGPDDSAHRRVYLALRHGVNGNSRPLLMMPQVFSNLSAQEIEAISAYIDSLPESPKRPPRSELGIVGRTLLLAGKLDEDFLPAEHIDHAAPTRLEPPATGSLAYGRHAAVLCTGCHRPDYAGGALAVPGMPPAANLTPAATGLRDWTQAQFFTAMRTGRRPDGRLLDAKAMPWPAIGQSSDAELESIWRYLRSVPPVERSLNRPGFSSHLQITQSP